MPNKPGRPMNPIRTPARDKALVAARLKRAQIAAATPPKPRKPIIPTHIPRPIESGFTKAVAAAAGKLLQTEGFVPITHVKPGPGGTPVRDEDSYKPAPSAQDHEEALRKRRETAAREAEVFERAEAIRKAQFGRPPAGKRMCEWTPAELAAEKEYQRHTVSMSVSSTSGPPRTVTPDYRFDPLDYP